MSSFAKNITIDAPIATVWSVLADIGSISRWNPGVIESHVTTQTHDGLHAGRHCDLGGKNYLDETVVEWQPTTQLTLRITETNLPFKSADVRFTLREKGNATMVTVSPQYELKYGLIGRLVDWLLVRRAYEKGMQSLLDGLKAHVEA